MTPRQQISRQRRPYALAALIGLGMFAAGLLLNRAMGETTLAWPPDGRGSAAGWVSLGLVLMGVATFLIAASLLAFRGDCPKCGRNMGPTGWRRKNYCPLCGVNLDEDAADAGMIAGAVLKRQRKEWALPFFTGILVLSNFALLAYVQVLYLRTSQLEMDRADNAKMIGRYYAQVSKTRKGESMLRAMCLDRLNRAQPTNGWDRLCLPSDELEYRKRVLDAFEKELSRRKSGLDAKEEPVSQRSP